MYDKEILRKKLVAQYLKIELYKKDFIENDPLCNYEIYLREILNCSNYFMELSGGEEFDKPPSEDKGQSDAITKKYQIDFKLFCSSTMMDAKANMYTHVNKLTDGAYCISGPKSDIKKSAGTRLRGALREVDSIEKIEELVNKRVKKPPRFDSRTAENGEEYVEYDLKKYFKMLKKDKNILIYLPENFFFDELEVEDEDAIEAIREALEKDFKLSIVYRNRIHPNRDNYLSCIYNDKYFLIFKFEKNRLLFIERIPYESSDTFMHLLRVASMRDF